jgi:hypothetical protein
MPPAAHVTRNTSNSNSRKRRRSTPPSRSHSTTTQSCTKSPASALDSGSSHGTRSRSRSCNQLKQPLSNHPKSTSLKASKSNPRVNSGLDTRSIHPAKEVQSSQSSAMDGKPKPKLRLRWTSRRKSITASKPSPMLLRNSARSPPLKPPATDRRKPATVQRTTTRSKPYGLRSPPVKPPATDRREPATVQRTTTRSKPYGLRSPPVKPPAVDRREATTVQQTTTRSKPYHLRTPRTNIQEDQKKKKKSTRSYNMRQTDNSDKCVDGDKKSSKRARKESVGCPAASKLKTRLPRGGKTTVEHKEDSTTKTSRPKRKSAVTKSDTAKASTQQNVNKGRNKVRSLCVSLICPVCRLVRIYISCLAPVVHLVDRILCVVVELLMVTRGYIRSVLLASIIGDHRVRATRMY